MAGSESPQSKRPNAPKQGQNTLKKPLQVMHISRKEEIKDCDNGLDKTNQKDNSQTEKTTQSGNKKSIMI